MERMLRSFWTDESGPGLAEYAVLIALITVALIAVITPFREAIIGVFTKVVAVLQSL